VNSSSQWYVLSSFVARHLIHLFLHQAQDYGTALRFDDSEYAQPYLINAYRVMLMMGASEYKTSTLAHMCTYMYHRKHQTPLFKMLKKNLGCINEESCEVSFSCLSRCVLGDTTKSTVSKLSEMYKLIPLFRECVSEVSDDARVSGGKSGYIRLSRGSPEVRETASFFQRQIKKAVGGKAIVYHKKIWKWPEKNRTEAHIRRGHALILPNASNRLYKEDVRVEFEATKASLLKSVDNYWNEDFMDIWEKQASAPDPLVNLPGDIAASSDSDDAEAVPPPVGHRHPADVIIQGAPRNRQPDEEEDEEKEPEDTMDLVMHAEEAVDGMKTVVVGGEEIRVPENEYVVGAVIGRRSRNRQVQYLVRWKGYDADDDTWEAEAGIIETDGVSDLIEAYKATTQLETKKKRKKKRATCDPAYKPKRRIRGNRGDDDDDLSDDPDDTPM
jgi:hypothetical protein